MKWCELRLAVADTPHHARGSVVLGVVEHYTERVLRGAYVDLTVRAMLVLDAIFLANQHKPGLDEIEMRGEVGAKRALLQWDRRHVRSVS